MAALAARPATATSPSGASLANDPNTKALELHDLIAKVQPSVVAVEVAAFCACEKFCDISCDARLPACAAEPVRVDTRPRVGDMVCYQRMPALAKATDAEVRERVFDETSAGKPHSVSKTHCDVVVHIDEKAAKAYVVGGNVQQSVTVKKLRLAGRSLKFSKTETQPGGKAGCTGWALPRPSADIPLAPTFNDKCSLNDKNWFVLLQMR